MAPQNKNSDTVRPPVVVVLGHVDHGKSTLLDYIRKSNTVAKEAGGITQQVAAYEVIHNDEHGKEKKITFLDTPGHEAFEAIRSRSTTVADIAILIVSAEDGVQKQTEEALAGIKRQKLPYVVAINKIDKPGAHVEKTIASLTEHEIYLEGRGGDVPYAEISAKTGEGVDALLELVLLVAELEELTGDPEKPAEGFVIESHRDPQKGISATLLITNGTLERGAYVATKNSMSPTRIMEDFAGSPIDTATHSSPVQIVGWSTPPTVGTGFQTFEDKKDAESYVTEQKAVRRKGQKTTREEEEKNITYIPLIIKANVTGSIDAIAHEIRKMSDEDTRLNIVHTDVGALSENDIKTAGGDSRTIVIGFNTRTESGVRELAEREGITIKTFDIIYELTEWLEKEIERRKPEETTAEVVGSVQILKTFSETKKTQVVGGRVTSGRIGVGDTVNIIRRDEVIGTGTIKELQSQKQEKNTINEGDECGMNVATSTTIAPKDTLEAISA